MDAFVAVAISLIAEGCGNVLPIFNVEGKQEVSK
jgi:hypothetical protein